MFTDIDECAASPCEHHCINALGSFNCDCKSGFTLKGDKITCQGKVVFTI